MLNPSATAKPLYSCFHSGLTLKLGEIPFSVSAPCVTACLFANGHPLGWRPPPIGRADEPRIPYFWLSCNPESQKARNMDQLVRHCTASATYRLRRLNRTKREHKAITSTDRKSTRLNSSHSCASRMSSFV